MSTFNTFLLNTKIKIKFANTINGTASGANGTVHAAPPVAANPKSTVVNPDPNF